jgi:hypothetical protein
MTSNNNIQFYMFWENAYYSAQKMHLKSSFSTLFLVLSSPLKWDFLLQIKFLQELSIVHFF